MYNVIRDPFNKGGYMSRKSKQLEFADEKYNVNITGRNVAVTEAMKNYAIEKVSKVERFTDRLIDVHVIMDIQKLVHRCEIIFKAGNTKITSSADTDEMYKSIDFAVKKLESQIRKFKSKLNDHHARDIPSIEMAVEVLQREAIDEFFDEDLGLTKSLEEKFKPHTIVKKETRPLKTLTYEEAVMKMDLSNDPFLIFKNEADLKLKVIYRRKDDNYGIIEPKL